MEEPERQVRVLAGGRPSERAQAARPKYDVYSAACPTRQVLDLIADKWTALIVGVLSDRPYLFGELRTTVGGISAKVLAETLRALESSGLVDRKVFTTRRVTVEYSLTPLGRTLTEPPEAIREWAEEHIGEIERATARVSRAKKDASRTA